MSADVIVANATTSPILDHTALAVQTDTDVGEIESDFDAASDVCESVESPKVSPTLKEAAECDSETDRADLTTKALEAVDDDDIGHLDFRVVKPVFRDCSFGGLFCELTVVEVIEEYLQFQNLFKTSHALQSSLGQLVMASPSLAAGGSGQPFSSRLLAIALPGCEFSVARVMRDFDAGRRDELFDSWAKLIGTGVSSSPLGNALELRLRVHFGTLHTRKALATAREHAQKADRETLASVKLLPEHLPDFTDLKSFLSSRPAAASLDESAESLAPLFALPFVPKPHESPALRFIFEDAWEQKLRADLQAFFNANACVRHAPILRHLAGAMVIGRCTDASPPPASWHELLRIADLGLSTATQACRTQLAGHGGVHTAQLTQQHLFQNPRSRQMTPELLEKALEARRRLLAVASRPDEPPPAPVALPVMEHKVPRTPVTAAIGIRGRTISVDTEAQQSPAPVYQDRLWPMSREAAYRCSSASSGLGASHSLASAGQARRMNSARSLESRARTATAALPVPPALDFGRIAQLIAGEDNSPSTPSLLAVLKAVLRRLALPDEPIRPRRSFLAAFACFGSLRALAVRLGEIVESKHEALAEMALAVMGVCACEVIGRREIEAAEAQKQPGCIAALITVLGRAPVASLLHMHCLAVLQRLSLRFQLQSKMIQLGALEQILDILKSARREAADLDDSGLCCWQFLGPGGGPEAPDFSIEFTSALLMNLTLRSAGRKQCAALGAYSVLVNLIEHPNPQVRTHVNGTLYTLLGVPSMRQEAQQLGAEATFRAALSRVSPEDDLLRRQLEYLLLQLGKPADTNESDAEESDVDGRDAGLEGEADDGDNFLDEEELAAHFHLLSLAGELTTAAEAEEAAKEAEAAEEALRAFRATPSVADAQQRRFHAFISRSCRNLMSPKRRLGSAGEGLSLHSLLSPSPLPLPEEPSESSAEFGKDQCTENKPAVAVATHTPATSTHIQPHAKAIAQQPPLPKAPFAPVLSQAVKPVGVDGTSPSSSDKKRTSVTINQPRVDVPSPGGRGKPLPPRAPPASTGRGRQIAPSTGQGSNSSPSLPPLHAPTGGRDAGVNSSGTGSAASTSSQLRSRSEAPRRNREVAAAAAAIIDTAVSVSEDAGKGWRKQKPAAPRSVSLDSRTKPSPRDATSSTAQRQTPAENQSVGSNKANGNLPQLPRIHSQRRGI